MVLKMVSLRDNRAEHSRLIRNDLVHIDNANEWEIRIDKVKPWVVYFSVINHLNEDLSARYMLHGCGELGEPDVVTLYYRKPILTGRQQIFHGNYKPIALKAQTCDASVKYMFIKYCTPKANAHNQIDIDYFVKTLATRGFISGEWVDDYKDSVVHNNNDHQVRVDTYKALIRELEDKMREEQKHIIPVFDADGARIFK